MIKGTYQKIILFTVLTTVVLIYGQSNLARFIHQRKIVGVNPHNTQFWIICVVSCHFFQNLQELETIWNQTLLLNSNLMIFKPNYVYLNVNVMHLWGFKYKILHIPRSSSSANATMWIPFKSSSFKKEIGFLFVGILNLYLCCKMNPYRSKSKINFEEDFKTNVILLTQVSNMSSALSFLSVGLWRYLIWSLKATVSRVRSIFLEILKACFVKYIY